MTDIGAMVVRAIPPEDAVAHAAVLAPHVDELWVVEDCFYAGGVAQAAAVLEGTADVPVGLGIAPAPFRNVAALAMESAALARRHPGRFLLGIGHGVPSWMDQIGEAVDSPLTLLEETVAAVRGLLAGERVSIAGRYTTLRDVELEFPPAVVPPVLTGVRGPKSLRLSDAVASGTILAEWASPTYVRNARRLLRHRVVCYVAFHLADDDATALAACRDTAAAALERPEKLAAVFPNGAPPEATPETVLRAGTAVGAAPTAAAFIGGLVEAGADAVVLVPLGDPAAQLARAVDELLPLLRA